MRSHRFIRMLIMVVLVVFLTTLSISAEEPGLIYLIPITGEIDQGLVSLVGRGFDEAEAAGAELVVLEVDTYGGLVDAAIKIKDRIINSPLDTAAFVAGRAWSAGALITLAAGRIAMKPSSSIGAAETRPKEEKYISALRKEFKATAEKRGKNDTAAAAMVDQDIEIPGLISSGKLLTLTADEAVHNNIADLKADNISELYRFLNLQPARVISVQPTTPERLARLVTRPSVSTFLLTLGILALVFEAVAPGWGIGGTVGLLSLGLFFSGYMINGTAGWGLVILFLIGLILLALELFVIPGFGVTGIGGLLAIVVSLYFVFPDPGIALTVMASALLLSVVGAALMIKYFGASRFWRRISLGESQTREAGYVAHQSKQDLVGSRGQAVSPLRPAGIAEIAGQRLDVVSEGGFVDRGERIVVIKIAGSRIVVKPITEEDD